MVKRWIEKEEKDQRRQSLVREEGKKKQLASNFRKVAKDDSSVRSLSLLSSSSSLYAVSLSMKDIEADNELKAALSGTEEAMAKQEQIIQNFGLDSVD